MSNEITENNIFERQRKQLAEIAKKGAKINNFECRQVQKNYR